MCHLKHTKTQNHDYIEKGWVTASAAALQRGINLGVFSNIANPLAPAHQTTHLKRLVPPLHREAYAKGGQESMDTPTHYANSLSWGGGSSKECSTSEYPPWK